MIIKPISQMLAHRLLQILPQSNQLVTRWRCSQTKLDIFASNYHKIGPVKFKRSRAVQRVLSGHTALIETLIGKLDPLRTKVLSSESCPELQSYIDVYRQLRQALASCQINNQWAYNIISWYNMTSFYRHLLERLLKAAPKEIEYLVHALHAMKVQSPERIHEVLFSENAAEAFYKKLDEGMDVGVLRKLEKVLPLPLSFSKRKYYEYYFGDNIEPLLRSLKASDAEQVSNLVWLFSSSINAMCDDDVPISKLEKAMLTMRLHLKQQDLELMMGTYKLKGRIFMPIYQQYLRPYILDHKLNDFNGVVQALEFAICSEAQDKQLLQKIIVKLDSLPSTSILTPQMTQKLHFYSHYLRIKGIRAITKKNVETQLQQWCKGVSKSQPNNITKLVNQKQRRYTKGLFTYASDCTASYKIKLTPLESQELTEFQNEFKYKLGSLDIKNANIYKKARFCCIDMDYCIHARANGGNSEIINLQKQCRNYAFSSGRLSRAIQIRDQILTHYGIKVNHFNLILFKKRGRMSEEECLINRRVANTY